MNNITWSSTFLFWCLCPAQNALQVYKHTEEGGSAVFWAATEPFVPNNLPAIWRPESKP